MLKYLKGMRMTKTVKTEGSVFINGEFNHNIKCCYYINSQKKVYLRRNTYNEKNRNHDR